jgi:hypothetical protein
VSTANDLDVIRSEHRPHPLTLIPGGMARGPASAPAVVSADEVAVQDEPDYAAQVDFAKLVGESQALRRAIEPKLTDYIPHRPTPKQQAFLVLPHREAIYGGAAGGGKAIVTDLPVLTTSGWKTQGTLEVGDYVYGHAGQPTRVVWVSEVFSEPCYALRFSTGETIVAGERHRWVVQSERDRERLSRRDPEFTARRRVTRRLLERKRRLLIRGSSLGCWKRVMWSRCRGVSGRR